MANEMEKYYQQYYSNYGTQSYTMGANVQYSRVLTLIDWLKEHTKPGDTVVDVGCGDMALCKLVPDRIWLGIDINTEKAQGTSIEHDLAITPYPVKEKTIDAVVCSEVLEHVWDLRVVNKEIKRMLKPGGHYFMSTPNFDWIDHFLGSYQHLLFDPGQRHLFEHIRFYNLAVHCRFLEEAGFKIKEHTGADAQYSQAFVTARVELAKAMPGVPQGKVDQIIGKMFPTLSHTIMVRSQA